ncbi:MAG TPA: type VI secretion protein IcmF/TssM N-terminal domain-containing protein [Thermoanaerobaculia bacterium]|jgi:type VI secretion system protein ImpL|nr:type VI secretion protein IcmF/TssM N-terminal domain-containing protein [Thermoanaerobaculia bacterium]
MSLLARLSQNLPLTLAVLGLIVLAVVTALALLVRRRQVREEAAEPEEAPLAPAPPPQDGTVVDFRQVGSHQRLASAFRRAASELRRHLGGRDSRYRLPWFVLLGEASPEKSRLFQDSGLNVPLGEPEDPVPEQGDGCSFWFFDRGVVLDVSSDFVLRADGKSASERGFRHFLAQLRETRPERPLDGVVLAIPCAGLIGPADEEGARLALAAEKGAALFRKLRQAQEALGMLFPVYVVVTGCEKIPGFASFVSEVPRHLRGDLFGWSCPYAPETAYRPEWVDEAFTLLGAGLQRTQIEAFGDQDVLEDPDGVFCFPDDFQRLRGPLRVYLNQVFRASSYHELLPLRGLYFCGRLSPAEGGVPDLLREPAAVGGSVFVRDVFDRKVFPERDLAHPSSLALIHGGRRLQVLRAVAAGLALVTTLGLGWAWYRLDARRDNLRVFLVNTSQDLEETRARRAVGAAEHAFLLDKAFHLVEGMSRLDADWFGSVFLPSSWFSPFNGALKQSMVHAWDEIILDSLYQELGWSLDRVLAEARPAVDTASPASIVEPVPGAGAAPGDAFIAWEPDASPEAPAAAQSSLEAPDLRVPAETPEFKRLNRYTGSLRQLEGNITLYNRLRTTQSLDDLNKLVQYLFDRELPKGFFQNSELYVRALADVQYDRFKPLDHRPRTMPRANELSASLYERLFDRNPVLLDLRRAAELAGDAADSGWDPSGGGPSQRVAALIELHERLHRAEEELAAPELAWMAGDTLALGPAWDQLLQGMRATVFLGPDTAGAVQREGDRRFLDFRRALLQIESRSTGPMVERNAKTGAIGLSPRAKLLADALDGLSDQGFVSPGDEGRSSSAPLVPRGRVLWDTLGLQQAAALYQPYESFIQKTLAPFPPDLRNTLQSSARDRLGARMMEQVAAARQPGIEPDTASSLLLGQALDAEVANFQAASAVLVQLAGLFDKLGLLAAKEQVNAAYAAQGEQILADADRLLVLEAPYTPKESGFDWWNGARPPAFEAYGTGDEAELAAYLGAQRADVAEIASRYAEPVMQALGGRGGASSRGLRAGLSRWTAISQQLKENTAKQPGNSVSGLEDFILKDLTEIEPANCSRRITTRMLAEPVDDFFEQRRSSLRRQVWERCRELAGGQAAEGYRKIEAFFNQRLAGKFPFSSGLPTRLDTEADPADLRAFFTLYDAYAPIVRAVPEADRPPGTGEFIARMGEVRTFFKPFLEDPAQPDGPSFDLTVRFRENRRAEKGGDRIIRWSLASGEQTVTHPNAVPTVPWTYGTPIKVELQWAKDSPVIPVESAELAGVAVKDRTAVLEFTDRWSLFTLLRRAASLQDAGDRSVQMLRFEVATRPASQDAELKAEPESTRVFVRLGLRAPEAKEKAAGKDAAAPAPAATDLEVPAFPTAAPRWTYSEDSSEESQAR